VIDALEHTDAEALRAELDRDPGPGHPLLSNAALLAWERRRRAVLAYVHAEVRAHGESAVYTW